jgi:hypothetical protein
MRTVTVTVPLRKLNCTWTIEPMQAMVCEHGPGLEEDLAAILTTEILASKPCSVI